MSKFYVPPEQWLKNLLPFCKNEADKKLLKEIYKMARVVHCKKEKYDVYIGRPSKWGNPFTIGKDGTREEVIEKYETWIQTQPDLLSSLHELKGKTLACWCAPQACHGDVLVKLANE
jgi:hypothetical protein